MIDDIKQDIFHQSHSSERMIGWSAFSQFKWLEVSGCLQANCVDSTAEPEAVFAGEVNKLKEEKFKPREQLTLEPYERDHAVVVAEYRPKKKSAAS